MLEETKLIVPRSEYCGMPQFCASCLSTDNVEYKRIRSSGSLWSHSFEGSMPICARCARRSWWWSHPVIRAVLYVAIAAPGIAVNHNLLPGFWSWLTVLLLELCTYAVERLKDPVRVQSKSDGRLIFWFRNPEFARLFEAQNHCSYETATFAGVL